MEFLIAEINRAVATKDFEHLQTIARTLEKAAKGKNQNIVAIAKTLRNLAASWLAERESKSTEFDNLIRDIVDKANKRGDDKVKALALKTVFLHDQFMSMSGTEADSARKKLVACMTELEDMMEGENNG